MSEERRGRRRVRARKELVLVELAGLRDRPGRLVQEAPRHRGRGKGHQRRRHGLAREARAVSALGVHRRGGRRTAGMDALSRIAQHVGTWSGGSPYAARPQGYCQ